MTTARYRAYRDDIPQGPTGTHDEAWTYILQHQGQSVSYATTYAGWSIEQEPDARLEHTLHDPGVWAALRALPEIGSTEDKAGPDTPAIKLFYARGEAWWVLWETDEDTDQAFGWAELHPGGGELGYTSLRELARASRTLTIPIERDAYTTTIGEAFESRQRDLPSALQRDATRA